MKPKSETFTSRFSAEAADGLGFVSHDGPCLRTNGCGLPGPEVTLKRSKEICSVAFILIGSPSDISAVIFSKRTSLSGDSAEPSSRMGLFAFIFMSLNVMCPKSLMRMPPSTMRNMGWLLHSISQPEKLMFAMRQ